MERIQHLVKDNEASRMSVIERETAKNLSTAEKYEEYMRRRESTLGGMMAAQLR
jgi:hypothetical protein